MQRNLIGKHYAEIYKLKFMIRWNKDLQNVQVALS